MKELITTNVSTLQDLNALSHYIEVNSNVSKEHFDDTIGHTIMAIGKLQSLTTLAESCVLYNVEKLWEEGKIHKDIIREYNDDFLAWAVEATKNGNVSPERKTIRDKIQIYKYYFTEGEDTFNAPDSVYTFKDDEYIEVPVKDKLDTVAFNKLQAAKGLARRNGNELSDALLLSMVNDNVKTREFRQRLADETEIIEEDDIPLSLSNSSSVPIIEYKEPQLSVSGFWQRNGVLMYTSEDGSNSTFTLGKLEPHNTRHPLAVKAVKYVFDRLDCVIETNEILDVSDERVVTPMFTRTSDGNLLINLDGFTFKERPWSAVREMIEELEELEKEFIDE